MSDTPPIPGAPTGSPIPPAPPVPPPPEWVSRAYWKIARYSAGTVTLGRDFWKLLYNFAGPVALVLVLFGFQGIHFHLPNFPVWPAPTPAPVPPVPPKPPEPPLPPAPIAAEGLHVLIVYESADLSKLPASQAAILTSSALRDYLNAHCPAGADGQTKEWRVLDKDADMTAESPLWQAAMKRPRQSLPWLVVSDGKTGFEGPLPSDLAGTVALIQKYGGV